MADASTPNPAPDACAETAAQHAPAAPEAEPIIRCRNVTKKFGPQTVLDELTLDVKRGERLVILGGSGAGKSTLLGMMSAQTLPTSGQILINGKDLCTMSAAQLDKHRTTTGVLFQSGALFQSMSLAENIALPLREHTDLDGDTIDLIITMKLELVGLREHGHKKPSQISGGMKKRAGLARALALDPQIIFYDEPSAGLDPVSVTEVDQLMIGLNETLGVTTVVITHEMTSAFRIAHRLVLMDQGKFVADGTPEEMKNSDEPLVRQFINGLLEGPLTDRRDSTQYLEDLLRN
ncbi:MAG: ABC transporter ATP-binding protein [Planctomycetota bacterium]